MSDAEPGQSIQRFVLRAEAPLRVLAVASVCTVVGGVLLVLWAALGITVLVAVLGGLLLAFGVVAYVAAVVSVRRLAQTVELSRSGVRLGGRTLAWSAVKEVTMSGPRLSLVSRSDLDSSMQVVNPGGPADAIFNDLTLAIQEGLDADRGYRPLA